MTVPKPEPLVADASAVDVSGIQIPGATPGGVEAQLLNIDLERGLVASIIHLKPGASIPAHFHKNGPEAHYVLEGDLVDAGRTFGPGAYLTHAAGVVHGPHASVGGCKVLTVQGAKVSADDLDFHLVEPGSVEIAAGEGGPESAAADWERGPATTPPDMALEALPGTDLPETQKTAPTPDNPTNPTTG